MGGHHIGRGNSVAVLVLGFLVLAAGGCATYSSSFTRIERELAENEPSAALAVLDEESRANRDRLLMHMDRAMLLRMSGDLEASNRELERAKQVILELSGLSVREQSTALLVNDTATSYTGAAFERVMLHLYGALNYLELGQLDEARVEALQADVRLEELADDDPDSIFDSAPFARYLSGMIFEELGEWSDAMIAYRKAYQAYRQHAKHYAIGVPKTLQEDLLRSAHRVGLEDELARYREEFQREDWPPLYGGAGNGELVLLLHNGLVPIKREESITVPVPGQVGLVRISVPRYEVRPPSARGARVAADDREVATEVLANLAGQAVADLEAHRDTIVARTAARAAAKYAASYATGKENRWAGLLVNIAGVLTERADTRSWLTLPANIQMARLPLAPGVYDVEVELTGPQGGVVQRCRLQAVPITRGARTYRSLHWVSLRSVVRH